MAFPRSTSPSICVRAAAAGAGVGARAQPRHGFGPQRPAQRQRRGQQPYQRLDAAALHARGHRAGLRQPPAHGAAAHLLRRPALSALRPRQGRVRARVGAFHPHPGHSPHEPVPADPIAGPFLPRHAPTHPGGHRSPFPPPESTSVAGLWCPRIWPLPKAGISIVLRQRLRRQTLPYPLPQTLCFMLQLRTLSARPQTQRQALTSLSLPGPARPAPPDAMANQQPGVYSSPRSITPSVAWVSPSVFLTGMALKGTIFCHPSARSHAWPHPQLIVASISIPRP